ncbi:DUF1127 domain-containing protein [Salinarimonas sp.]|uniref:DUF1127 domain-containing protein n=1 Tax=Salinarimonas sp. TaxID=2766526 RepID=UPI0032D95758
MSTLTDRHLAVLPAAAPALPARTPSALARVVATILQWRRRAAGRRALAEMSPRMLADIGVSRFEAGEEASKPFWRT